MPHWEQVMEHVGRKPLSPVLLWSLIIPGAIVIARQWWPDDVASSVPVPAESQPSRTAYFIWVNFVEPRQMSIEPDATQRDALALMTARFVAPVVLRFRCDATHSLRLSNCAECPGDDQTVHARLATFPAAEASINFLRNDVIDIAITPEDLRHLEQGETVSLVYSLTASEKSDGTVLAQLDLVCTNGDDQIFPSDDLEFEPSENQRHIEVRPKNTD